MLICTLGHFVDVFIGGFVTGLVALPIGGFLYLLIKR